MNCRTPNLQKGKLTNQQAFSQSLAGFSRKKRKRLGRLTPLASWVGWIGGNEELLARSIVA